MTPDELSQFRSERLAPVSPEVEAMRALTKEIVALREQRKGGGNGGNGHKAAWHKVRYEILMALVIVIAGMAWDTYLDVRDLKDKSHPPAEVLLRVETLESDVNELQTWRIRVTEGR